MSSDSLLSRRNKIFAVVALIAFSLIITLVGRVVLRNQLPSLIGQTPESNKPATNFKADLKLYNNLYGINQNGLLVPEFTQLPSGKFLMGGTAKDPISELPQHEVVLAPFSISRTEITNAQFLAFCQAAKHKIPEDPHWQGIYMRDYPNHPIVNIAWQEAVEYCNWLSTVLGTEVRLPTEAEWEYAAQTSDPGTTLEFAARELLPTTKVGSYPPSQLGLYDMLGNVWEWCNDWYDPEYYQTSPKENPKGPEEGRLKVIRGGSWAESRNASRPSHRNSALPNGTTPTLGFRVVMVQSTNKKD